MSRRTMLGIGAALLVAVAAGAYVYLVPAHRAPTQAPAATQPQASPPHPAPGAVKLTIGIATWPGFASGMIGTEKHFFDGIDLHFRTIDDLPARHAAFQSGDLDILVSSVDLNVQEQAQNLPGKMFLVTDESFGGDGIVAGAAIKTILDLRGKKVAFARATPSHYLLFKALEKAGLNASDVEQAKVEDPGQAGTAFVGGSVDAAVTWEPFLTQVRDSGKGHVLATSRDFPGTIVDVLVASPKLAANRDVLSRFIKGWLRSVDYIAAHPEESARIMALGLNVKPEDAQSMMAGLRFADTARNRYFLCGPDKPVAITKIIQDASAFWQSQGIVSTKQASDSLISTVLCDLPAGTP